MAPPDLQPEYFNQRHVYRVGHGWDRHRLATPDQGGRPLVVGGVRLESPVGPVAHSDGDALLHAVTDALLGGSGHGDIGQLFPDSDPEFDGADSLELLRRAAGLVDGMYIINNVDATVKLQSPKLGAAREQMEQNIASALGIDKNMVNVKGKTGEGIGEIGRGEAIEADVVMMMWGIMG